MVARELLCGCCEVVDCCRGFYMHVLVGFTWLPECFYLTDIWGCGLSLRCFCAFARVFSVWWL